MGTTFSSIQDSIFNFLVKQNKLKAQENVTDKIDFTEMYALLKITAPTDGIDLESPEGIEYIKSLVEEFMELDYITELIDDNKDGTLSVSEKSGFMKDDLELDLTAEQLEQLFGTEEIEVPEQPSGSDGGGGGGGGGGGDPTTSPSPNGSDDKSESETQVSSNAKVESARRDMLDAEDAYREKLNEVFKDNTEILNLEQSRDSKNQELQNKREEKNVLSNESNELTGTISSLETKISNKDSEIASCQSSISSLQSQIAAAGENDDVSSLQSQLAALRAQLQRLENEKKDLVSEKQDAEDRKDEIDNTLIPAIDESTQTLETELAEIEGQIKEKLANCKEVSDLYTDFLDKKNTYTELNEAYLKEQKEEADKKAEAEKAERQSPKAGVEDDKEYANIDDILYESKIKDSVTEYVKGFAEDSEVSYTHTSAGNYEVKETRKDGVVVVTVFDANGEISSTRSSSLSVLTVEQEAKVSEVVSEKFGENPSNVEYSKSGNGTIIVSVKGDDGKFTRLVFNKDGELTGSDDIEETVSEEKAKEAIKQLDIPSGASVNYQKDGDNYTVTITDENGNETSYKYDKEGQLVSSSDADKVAGDKKEDIQAALKGIAQNGEKLEYKKNDDGSYSVVGTYGGIETIYAFDKDGNYIGSSDAKDGFSDSAVRKELTAQFAEIFGDETLYYRTEENGNISMTTSKGIFVFSSDGYTLSMESSNIADFEELGEDSQKQIGEILTSKNISGDVTYKFDYLTNEYSVETTNGDETISYTFVADNEGNISLVGSPDIKDVVEDETQNEKIQISIAEIADENSKIQYHKDGDDKVTVKVTDENGNVSQYTYDKEGKIIASSDINVVDDTEESVKTQIMSELENTNAELSDCVIQKADDGTFLVKETKGSDYALYLFDEKGNLKSITANDAAKLSDDNDVKSKIETSLSKMGAIPSDCMYTTGDDGSIIVDLGVDGNNNSINVKFDKEGNIVSSNYPYLLFENSQSADYAVSMLTDGLGLDISGAEYVLTPDGSIKVTGKTEENEDYTVVIDPKHGDITGISVKEDAWMNVDEAAISSAEETLISLGVDVNNIMYSNDGNDNFSAVVIEDGYQVEYHFDSSGKFVKYENSLGVYEQKTDENGASYIEYTASSYPKTATKTVNIELSEIAGKYAPETLKEINSYQTQMNVEGKTDAEKIAGISGGLGNDENGNVIEATMSEIYEGTQNAEKVNGVYPNGTIVISSGNDSSEESLQGGIVAGSIDTDDGLKYIILEPSSSGDVKVVIRDESELEFRSRNN